MQSQSFEEAGHAARQDDRQPVLRSVHAHPHQLRNRGQAAGRRRRFDHRVGLQRLQGRIAGGHAEHAGGDAAGRHRDAPRGLAARRIFWRATCRPRSSTPATARTSIPRRRCSMRAPFSTAAARSKACAWRSSATSRTAAWRARNVHLLSKFGAEIVLCGPASLLPAELAQLAPGVALTTDIREAIRDADVIMMLRVQLERQHEAAFPASEYFRFYGLRLEHLELAKPDAIVMHPGPINRGREISSRGGGLPAVGDPEPGGERHRGAHGGARKGDCDEHADRDQERPRDRPGIRTRTASPTC